MQQVFSFINGTLNYEEIVGSTGPIVYPAGHLYVYSLLYFITNNGTNILCAQYIFAFIYLITLFAVFRIYLKLQMVSIQINLIFENIVFFNLKSRQ
jgi:alpha-1,3-mannosyltransferase